MTDREMQTSSLPTPKVQRYWAAVASRLATEAKEMAGLLNHNGERGRMNESSFGRLFKRMLPPSVRVSTGEIIDSSGGSSSQMDTLVLSNTLHPVLFAQTDEALFPVETVLLCVEVKTTLTSEEVADIVKKVRKHRALAGADGKVPALAVFAHKAGGTPKNVAKWFFELDDADRPAFFLVNDSAVFGFRDTSAANEYQIVMPIAPKPGEQESCDFGPETAASPEAWKPMNLPKGPQVRVDQGAAMLLFVRESLNTLNERGHADIAWLGSYLDKIQQQHIRYKKGADGFVERNQP